MSCQERPLSLFLEGFEVAITHFQARPARGFTGLGQNIVLFCCRLFFSLLDHYR